MAVKRSRHTFLFRRASRFFFDVGFHPFSIRPSRSLIRVVVDAKGKDEREGRRDEEEGMKMEKLEEVWVASWNRKWYFGMHTVDGCNRIRVDNVISLSSSVLWKWIFWTILWNIRKLVNVWIRGMNGLSIRFFSPSFSSFAFLEGWIFSDFSFVFNVFNVALVDPTKVDEMAGLLV